MTPGERALGVCSDGRVSIGVSLYAKAAQGFAAAENGLSGEKRGLCGLF